MVAIKFPAFSLGASTLGNTLGDTGITGTRVVLVGSGNITLSQATDLNGGTITISGSGGGAGGDFSVGVSGGNTAGSTGLTGSMFALAGGNNITLSQSTDANGGTVTIVGPVTVAQTVQTQNLFDLTISGNTDGAGQLVSSGTLSLAGGSNITLSQNGNAISIIGPGTFPETQTAISGVGNSETTYTSGTVNLSGLGNLTVRSTTGNAFQFSVAPQSVQPETQTFIGGVAGSNTTYTSGTVNITGSGIVTVQSGTGQRLIINASQSVQPETQTFLGGLAASNTTYTSGTVTITGVGGGITVSSNTGQRIDLSVAAQTNQSLGMYALGNTTGQSSSTTMDARTLSVRGDGIVSVGYSGGSLRISASQSVQAETQTFVGGIIASDTTYTSGSVRFTGVGGGVTVSSNTGQRVDISVAAQTGTQFSAGLTNSGNTSGDTGTVGGRLLLVGTNNITLSGSTNGASMTVTLSGPSVAGAQTGISGLANSQTTYTSGTVSLSELGAITIRSTTGQQFQFSVNSQTAESQSIGMSNIGNTSGTTGIASGAQVRFLLAGGNNVTLSQSLNGASGTITISAFNQSVQTQGILSAGVSTGGNTSGDTTVNTGSRLVFVGSNNITVSQGTAAGASTITISGPTTAAQTNQTLGMYAVQNTTGQSSSTTMDARTLSVAGDGIVSVGYSAGSLRISASQSNQSEGWYALGNTTGQSSSTTLDARTISIRGDGIVSVGYSGGSLRISASQSVQAETQTFIGGVANTETTYTSGTVKLLELGAITIRSTTGNQFQLSVNAQTGTQFSAGLSNIGNTLGDTGTKPGRLVLAGGANITLSGSTNGDSLTITVSGGAGGGFSAGVSTGGNTSGSTGVTGTRLVLAGGNSITLSQSTDANGGTVSVSAPNASVLSAVAPLSTSTNGSTISILGPAQLSVGFSTQGNTSGNTGFVTGQLQLVGSNGITLSGSTNGGSQTITISGITQSAESQSFGMSNIGNTSGTTGIASGAQLRFVLAGGNNITLSQSLNGASGTITISAPNTAAQTNQTLGMYAVQNTTGQSSSTTMDARTLSVAGDGAVSVGYSAGSLRISAPTQSVQTQGILSAGVSTGGNTAGNTTVNTGSRLVFVGTNMISISEGTAAGASTLTLDATNQNLSIGVSTGGNTSGNTTVNTGSRLVLVGSNGITASQGTAAGATTITLSGRDPGSVGMSTQGNTAGDTGFATQRLALVGSNNITLSGSTNGGSMTISIAAPSPGAAQYSIGASNLGNTAGSTGVTGTRIVFVGTNNLSLSQSTDATGATISFNNTVSAFQEGVSTMGNTAGDTGVTGTRMVWVGSSPVSLSQATGANGGTITINAPATSSLSAVSGIKISTNGSTISIGYGPPIADWENMPRAQASLLSHLSGFSKTPIYWNDEIAGDLTAKSLAFAVSMVTASQPLSLSAHLGIYSIVNSTSASLIGSVSEAYVVSSASSVSLSGVRNLIVTGIGTHTALSVLTRGEYMIGMMFSATATNAMNASLLGASGGAGPLGGIYPGTNQLSTGTTQGIQQLAGRGSVTVNAMPANVAASDVINQGTAGSMALHPWIYIRS